MRETHQRQARHYVNLGIMAALSFAAMYFLMYSMVSSIGNVYMSLNQVYMAGVMAAPMIIIELIVMRMMYPDPKMNRLIIGGATIVGVAMFLFIRQQSGVGDRQFVRSMIPHHSGAILMCREASIRDSELKKLCGDIVSSQQREIDQMKALLDRLP